MKPTGHLAVPEKRQWTGKVHLSSPNLMAAPPPPAHQHAAFLAVPTPSPKFWSSPDMLVEAGLKKKRSPSLSSARFPATHVECPVCHQVLESAFVDETDHLARCRAAPHPGALSFSGPLAKRGSVMPLWNTRYCEVSAASNSFTTMKSSRDDSEAKGKKAKSARSPKAFHLEGAVLAEVPPERFDVNFVFSITLPDDTEMLFKTTSEESMRRWIREIIYARDFEPLTSEDLRPAAPAPPAVADIGDLPSDLAYLALAGLQSDPATPPTTGTFSPAQNSSELSSLSCTPVLDRWQSETMEVWPGGRRGPNSPATPSPRLPSRSPQLSPRGRVPGPRRRATSLAGPVAAAVVSAGEWNAGRVYGLDDLRDDERFDEVELRTVDCCDERASADASAPQSPRSSPRLSDFDLVSKIGRGAFAKVFLVRGRASGKYFAMKVVDKRMLADAGFARHAREEKAVLTLLKHPFIVRLHYAFQSVEKLYMVLDFINGGELYVHLRRAGLFSEQRTKLYVAEIALALDYLHSNGIIYRDLKPENLLLDRAGHIRLTDFGLVKKTGGELTSTLCGTRFYLAPEMVMGRAYDGSVDWWALGIVAFECLTGRPPFVNDDKMLTYFEIISARVPVPDTLSKHAKNFLYRILNRDISKRLGCGPFSDLKRHAFFSGLDWDAVLHKRVIPEFVPGAKNDKSTSEIDAAVLQSKVDESDLAYNSMHSTDGFEGFTYGGSSQSGEGPRAALRSQSVLSHASDSAGIASPTLPATPTQASPIVAGSLQPFTGSAGNAALPLPSPTAARSAGLTGLGLGVRSPVSSAVAAAVTLAPEPVPKGIMRSRGLRHKKRIESH